MEEERAAREWDEAGDGRPEIPPSTTSAAANPDTDPGKSSEDQSVQKGRQIAGGEHEVSTVAGGQELAVSSMVSSNEVLGDQWQTTLNPHGRDDQPPHNLGGSLQSGRDHSEIPLPSSTQQPRAGHPLEAGCGHEMSRGACDDQEASSIQPLAIGLSEDQTSLTSAKQAGRSTSTGPSTQEENQMILQLNRCLQTITLVNNNVECYINSAFWTVCWAHLLCTQQSIADWKGMNAPFHRMLCESTHQKLDLKHHHSMAWGMQTMATIEKGWPAGL